MKWICVDFIDSWGIWCPWVDFLRISSIVYDFRGISWDPGARGRAAFGGLRPGITRESWPYRNLAILELPRGMDDSMIRC